MRQPRSRAWARIFIRPELTALTFAAICFASPSFAQQAATSTLSYQASINNEGPLIVTTRFYTDPAGLDLVWEETSHVTVTAGVLNLNLGASVPLPLEQMDEGLYLGVSIDNSDELRPLTKLSASPLALSVPDRSITKDKIGAHYIESITINGKKVEGSAASLRIETGKGITAGYDEATNTILLAASSSRSKGSAGTLSDETIDGNLIVNGHTDLGGNAANPTITFTAKAASDLDMNSNDLDNAGSVHIAESLTLDANAILTVDGSSGTAGQVLTSQGSATAPTWVTPENNWSIGGDAGTTAGTDFLGTLDNQAFEIHIDHNGSSNEGRQRALRLEPTAQSPNVVLGYNQNAVDPGFVGGTISGGGELGYSNLVNRDYGTISGGRANTAGQYASVGGGEFNEASNAYATVGGGYSNRSSNTSSTTAGGFMNWARGNGSFVGGGEENEARGNLSVIGGGYNNNARSGASTIAGGENNTTESTNATIGGGSLNYADGFGSTVAGGENNYASGLQSAVSGGEWNYAQGHYSAILGGRYLTVGANSLGFNGDNSAMQIDLSGMSQIAYLGNVDLMLGNVDNTARSLKLYAPNTDYTMATAFYTSFKAPALGANIEYTLPVSQGANTSVLHNDGSGQLYWSVLTLAGDVTGPLGNSTVQFVGGQSAASVASAAIAVASSTSLNTPSTLVLRDGSGNFSAGTITANLTGNVLGDITGNVSGNAGTVTNGVYTNGSYADPVWITSLDASKITGLSQSDSVGLAYYAITAGSALTAATATNATNAVNAQNAANATTAQTAVNATNAVNAQTALTATSATNATNAVNATSAVNAQTSVNFSGSMSGDVTGTQSATVVSTVDGLSAANVAAGATLANNSTSNNTANSIVRRNASGDVSVGTLLASDGVSISGGVLQLSNTSVASANAGVTLPSGYSIVRITGGASTNFNYTLPSGSEGQILFVYNNHASRRANNAVTNIDAGEMRIFVYINSGWRLAS